MNARKAGDYIQTKILHSNHTAREEDSRVLGNVAQENIGSEFFEEDPSVSEWFRDLLPTAADAAHYLQNLFPSASWIRRYNLHWLLGDAIAGR